MYLFGVVRIIDNPLAQSLYFSIVRYLPQILSGHDVSRSAVLVYLVRSFSESTSIVHTSVGFGDAQSSYTAGVS